MSDEPNNTAQPPRETVGVMLRKLVFTVGVLFVVWLLFVQIAPRLMFQHNVQNNPPVTSEEPAPPQVTPSQTPITPPANNGEIIVLNNRVDTLEARLKVLEDVVTASPKPTADAAQPAAPATPPPAVAATPTPPAAPAFVQEARLAGLEKKLSEQEEALQNMQIQVQESQSKTGNQLAGVTVFAQMKETIQRGEPFAMTLTQLKNLTQDDGNTQALIAQLTNYADKGVPTTSVLKSAFETAVDHALSQGEDAHSLLNNMRSLIRIRKVGQQQGNSDEAIIARAETDLTENNVDAALKEIATLPPPAADAFAQWAAEAQGYAAVHHAIDALQLALTNTNATETDQSE